MRMLIIFTIGTVVQLAAVQAQDIGDVQQGRRLALDVCASCHAVRSGDVRSAAAAPSFQAVANTPGMTAAALAYWLTAHAHPTMPMIILSPQEVRDVSAYILSLRH